MKIIDAHLHIFPAGEAAATACGDGAADALRRLCTPLDIVHGVVMGNRSLAADYHDYPPDFLHYCVGLDSRLVDGGGISDPVGAVERHLRRENCCGVKLYPGYNKLPLTAPMYRSVYELAGFYGKPVAVHTGLTAFARAHLKYCHPLALDEVAADHPGVSFVMCHFGNPFLESAAAVLVKNPNVSADISGLLEDPVELEDYFREQTGYVALLRTWLAAANCWDRILYGSDWPIIAPERAIAFAQALLPQAQWEAVFFRNANRVYGLGL